MDPKNWEKIKFIQTPEEISESVKKQIAERLIRTLRKITLKNIFMKIG